MNLLNIKVVNDDCINFLRNCGNYNLIFADPPDNLGLKYNNFVDKNPSYYAWLEEIIRLSIKKCDTFWLSYYWKHDLEIKYRVKKLLDWDHRFAKTFIWRYRFGQYKTTDAASGYRYLLRISKRNTFNQVLVPSVRMEMGDKRAAGLRNIDDVWDIPRITGNHPERESWHPTQHPVEVLHRIVQMSTNDDDSVLDLFAGSGSMAKVGLRRFYTLVEIDPFYCEKIIHNG